jgi:pimeloyl-ACP methyl ester carboxylesterase
MDPWPSAGAVRALAARFRNGSAVFLPDAGHFPWIEDAGAFTDAVMQFLERPVA